MFDKKTYALLKLIYKRGRITNEEADALVGDEKWHGQNARVYSPLSAKLISYWSEITEVNGQKDHENIGYKITLEGRAYVEQRERETRNFWVPYILTTLIAIASLICSALSIVVAVRAGQP